MRELATQAANDTNVDVDRKEIQREMSQLTSEINRIGNTTEFNTQKVLMGKDGGSTPTVSAAKVTGAVDAGTLVTPTAGGATLAGGADLVAGTKTTTVAQNAIGSPTADLTGAASTGAKIEISVGSKTYTVDNTAIAAMGVPDEAKLLAAIGNADDGSGNKLSAVVDVAKDGSGKLSFTAKNSGTDAITATLTKGTGSEANALETFTGLADATATTSVNGTADTAATAATGAITFDATSVSTVGTKITAGDKTYELYNSDNGAYSGANVGIDIKGAATNEAIIDKLVAAAAPTGATLSKTNATTLTVTASASGVAGNSIATSVAAGAGSGAATAASSTISFDATKVAAEGTQITVGDKVYELFNSDKGAYAGTNVGIDIKGATTNEAVIDKLVAAAAPTGATVSKVDATTLKVTTTATGAAANDSIATSVTQSTNAGGSFKASLQIGANQGQGFEVEIHDMRASALKISGKTAADNTGVTGAKFTAIANVSSGTDNNNAEFALDVSSNATASAAIKVLNSAIDTVSAERSTLGAYQNRLEHTIANLGTASENLTAAESRVRDVDMAKEMMSFSKNNILSQASQAMLAQAKSQPEAVLQLLR